MSEAPKRESLEVVRQRLADLQTPLSRLMDLGLHVHRTFRPDAQHPLHAPADADIFAVSSMNRYGGLPVSDTLTLRLGTGEHISIERYNGPTLIQPIWRIDHWAPHDEGRQRRIRIQQFREESGAHYPFDIEVGVYSDGGKKFDEFIGYAYQNHEPHISEVEDKLLSLVLPDEPAV